MFAIDTTDIQRLAISSIGALILSAACVIGAVGPAKAAEANAPLTSGDWQAQVERQIDRNLRIPTGALEGRDHAIATVRIRFDVHGDYAGVKLAQGSGIAAVDREALRVAHKIAFPVLPSGLRGKPQTVGMNIYFGNGATSTDHQRAIEMLARGPAKPHEATQTAALPTG